MVKIIRSLPISLLAILIARYCCLLPVLPTHRSTKDRHASVKLILDIDVAIVVIRALVQTRGIAGVLSMYAVSGSFYLYASIILCFAVLYAKAIIKLLV